MLPRQCFPIYNTLADLTNTNDGLHVLQVVPCRRRGVPQKEWEITLSEESALWSPLSTSLKSGAAVRFLHLSPLHLLTHLRGAAYHSLDPASQATRLACSMQSLRPCPPTIFDFDLLFDLDAVLAAQALFALLRIFINGGMDDSHAWKHAHADATGECGTSPTQVECWVIDSKPSLHPPTKPFFFLSLWR